MTYRSASFNLIAVSLQARIEGRSTISRLRARCGRPCVSQSGSASTRYVHDVVCAKSSSIATACNFGSPVMWYARSVYVTLFAIGCTVWYYSIPVYRPLLVTKIAERSVQQNHRSPLVCRGPCPASQLCYEDPTHQGRNLSTITRERSMTTNYTRLARLHGTLQLFF